MESFKVVLVGESGVGKTSIIAQYIDQTFQEDLQTSTGGTFSTKTVSCDGKLLKFEIWDTAGQEQYRSLSKMFYKEANAALMVYDITRKRTFIDLKEFWYEQIKDCSPVDIMLVIVGNKSDLIDKEEVNEEEVRNYAKEINAMFFSTSAKNYEGINNLFEEIAKKYTGATNVKIIDEEQEGDTEPPENDNKNNNIKIGKETNKKDKKKGCC